MEEGRQTLEGFEVQREVRVLFFFFKENLCSFPGTLDYSLLSRRKSMNG